MDPEIIALIEHVAGVAKDRKVTQITVCRPLWDKILREREANRRGAESLAAQPTTFMGHPLQVIEGDGATAVGYRVETT